MEKNVSIAALESALAHLQICQDKIDEKNEKILELQNRVNMAALQASQTAQTAEIISKLPATTA